MTPFIHEFECRGHTVFITARNCFQISELLEQQHFHYQIISRHFGSSKSFKLFGLLVRSFRLAVFARKHQLGLAFSSGSPYQALAAFWLRIPIVVISDYEHSSVFSIIRYIAHRLIFPACISRKTFSAQGFNLERIITFQGLKEDIYLSGFKPDAAVLDELKLEPEGQFLIVLRPAACDAHYHNPKSELLMRRILELCKQQSDTVVVAVARGEKQRRELRHYQQNEPEWGNRLIIPEDAIDTLSLTAFADMMIGGGGTMNREAVALDIPTYSFFCGPIGDVDQYLKNCGRLQFIRSEVELDTIRFEKKRNGHYRLQSNNLRSSIIDDIFNSLNHDEIRYSG